MISLGNDSNPIKYIDHVTRALITSVDPIARVDFIYFLLLKVDFKPVMRETQEFSWLTYFGKCKLPKLAITLYIIFACTKS